ncbi:MAG TPA: hypothetical protein VMT32_06365 [Bryobacteraceae bacterium]|nr:hypothetical protein [Bryobacteraceae bacterium]
MRGWLDWLTAERHVPGGALVFKLWRATGADANRRSVPQADCEEHEDAAKRLGHAWRISERKPTQSIGRDTKYLAG